MTEFHIYAIGGLPPRAYRHSGMRLQHYMSRRGMAGTLGVWLEAALLESLGRNIRGGRDDYV